MVDATQDVNVVLERLLTAYNASTQKELAQAMGVHPGNVSSWIQRGSVPSSAILSCIQDTGADLSWLLTGKLKNVSLPGEVFPGEKLAGQALLERITESAGGKPVVQRIMDAYGYKTQKELGDRFDLSSGAISSWIRRGFFPGDYVLVCTLETGVSLKWLVTGCSDGNQQSDKKINSSHSNNHFDELPKQAFLTSTLKDAGTWSVQKGFIPLSANQPVYIEGGKTSWIIEKEFNAIGSGRWFIDIDGAIDVYDVVRLPGNKLKLSNVSANFECAVDDVKPVGFVVMTFDRNL